MRDSFCYAIKKKKKENPKYCSILGSTKSYKSKKKPTNWQLENILFSVFLGSVIFFPKIQSCQQFLERFAQYLAFQGFHLEHWLSHP